MGDFGREFSFKRERDVNLEGENCYGRILKWGSLQLCQSLVNGLYFMCKGFGTCLFIDFLFVVA